MNPTLWRVVQQTYQRSVKAMATNERDGAELEIRWSPLSGMVKGGLTEPMTWQRLKEIRSKWRAAGLRHPGKRSSQIEL
jgi:hypothetical protein